MSETQSPASRGSHPSIPFVAPFVVYVGLLAIERAASLPTVWWYPIRCLATLATLLAVSRQVASFRASKPWASAAVGVAVFLIWIAPDLVFGPGYRHFWLFANSLTGNAASSAPEALRGNSWFIVTRVLGCALLVPPVEEIFWRGWLIRWMQHHDFLGIPLGAYTRVAFWTTAALFAAEHGPYWEVGLGAGIVYNWWIGRTKTLGDVTVAHAVTNALLSAYVLLSGQWQYWM